MDYTILRPCRVIEVEGFASVHYFEYSSHYAFEGESHDFWEFLYVDKGELDVTAGDKLTHLKKGQMIFHKPGEFHNLRANGTVAPNLVVASFTCHSEAMRFFEEKVVLVSDVERALMAQMIEEAESAFTTPLSDPDTRGLDRREAQPFGAEQMIALCIEHMLISFIRRTDEAAPRTADAPHDDAYQDHELERAAAAYALAIVYPQGRLWPWNPAFWRPRGHRENLVRAAALLVAAIEAIDRAEA